MPGFVNVLRSAKNAFCAGVMLFALLAVGSRPARATSPYSWITDNGGFWTNAAANGWNTGGGTDYPNAIDAVAYFTNNIGTTRPITNNAAITLGTLVLDDTGATTDNGWQIITTNNSAITFQVSSGSALLQDLSDEKAALGTGNMRVLSGTGQMLLNSSLVINVASNSETLLIGNITGGADKTVTKTGAGAVSAESNANGASSYGTTIVAEGTFQGHRNAGTAAIPGDLIISNGATYANNNPEQIADTSAVTANGTFNLNNRTQAGINTGVETIATLLGSGIVTMTSTSAGSTATLILAGSATNDFSGTIAKGSNTISIVRSGTGTQILSGNNLYTGTTIVSNGTLVVNGTHTGGGAYTVVGGTLGGTGTIVAASVTIQSGGTLSPGASIGTLSVSNLSLQSGAKLTFELAATGSSDKVIDFGVLTLANQTFADFTFTTNTGFGAGTYTLIAANGSAGSFAAVTNNDFFGYTASLDRVGNNLILEVIPEPSSLLLVGLGVCGAWFVSRRR